MTTRRDGHVPGGRGSAQAGEAELPDVESARASVEKARRLLQEVPHRPEALDEARAAIQEGLDAIPG
jgi:predicted RNase H-like HicB family nuclease